MKSTGEVMGVADTFPAAFGKAQVGRRQPAADRGHGLPERLRQRQVGRHHPRPAAARPRLPILATRGTARALQSLGVPTCEVNKVIEGTPHIVDLIDEGRDRLHRQHAVRARRALATATRSAQAALRRGVPCITTLAGASAAVSAIEAAQRPAVTVRCLQDLHAAAKRPA